MIKLTDEEGNIARASGRPRTRPKAATCARFLPYWLKNTAGSAPHVRAARESLPGVGHKTASVVMSQAFGVPAFPVDTHIHRLMTRWGLTCGKSVEQTEKDAKRLFPGGIVEQTPPSDNILWQGSIRRPEGLTCPEM